MPANWKTNIQVLLHKQAFNTKFVKNGKWEPEYMEKASC
jgi:hypothetical protein